jgi:hypothetical protein
VNRPRAADDFATIRARMEELRREREGTKPSKKQAQPDPQPYRGRDVRWSTSESSEGRDGSPSPARYAGPVGDERAGPTTRYELIVAGVAPFPRSAAAPPPSVCGSRPRSTLTAPRPKPNTQRPLERMSGSAISSATRIGSCHGQISRRDGLPYELRVERFFDLCEAVHRSKLISALAWIPRTHQRSHRFSGKQ